MPLRIPRLILGSQPFLGESYQGEEKNRIYRDRFSDESFTTRLLIEAYRLGLDTVSVMAMPDNHLFQKLLKVLKRLREEGLEFKAAPCISIPLRIDETPVEDYRRWLTYYVYESKLVGEEAVKGKYFQDPILLTRPGWRERFSKVLKYYKPYTETDFKRLRIDFKAVSDRIRLYEDLGKPFANIGSESDFLAVAGRFDLLGEMIDRLRAAGYKSVLISSHHAGSTIPLVEDSRLKPDGYATPLNPLGALMLPSMESALNAIRMVRDKVVAIKPLAGGRVDPFEAFRFLADEEVKYCMVGVASLEELKADVEASKYIFRL
ncbi:hypothetical protein CW710_00400 [Candidatus Bathyarchaeota archaeon]|nr:MAG: hypothetical protein CW710_00400 [Candidatus Bathyarchaeota archaeon]